MWRPSGLILITVITTAASFQLECVLNYLSEEEDDVGVVMYLGHGGENVKIFDELVEEKIATWTVINRYANSTNVVGTPGNYMVVAQGLEPERIIENALRQMSKFKELWEPSARMIVLLRPGEVQGTELYLNKKHFRKLEEAVAPTRTPRMYKSLASRIINIMWKYSVFDALVGILGDNGDQERLRLFSANPFADGNQCGKVVNNLFDLGCDSAQEYFEEERNIWKNPTDYPNCTLRVSRRESPPFSFKTPAGNWEGADIRFVELLSYWKNLTIAWSEGPAPESGYTAEEVHRYYKLFQHNSIDLAIGGIVMNAQHMYKVEYLRPHTQVSITYYVANAEKMKGWEMIHSMFDPAVWCILGVVLLSGGTVYSIMVEGRFDLTRTKFLNLLAVLVMQTLDLPKRWRIRILFVIFLFPLYHISSLHSTALQSFMVHTPKQKPISTEAELRDLNMTVYVSSTTRDLIADSKVHENMKISHKPLRDRLATLNKKKNYSIVARSLEVDFWRNTEHFQIHPIRPPISTFAVSLTMGKGSPYKEVIDSFAQQCLEAGLFEKWFEDLTSIYISNLRPKQVLYDSVSLEPLDMEDLEGALLILLVGLILSTGVFLGEICVHYSEVNFTKDQENQSVKSRAESGLTSP